MELEKIELKQTKVNLTISQETTNSGQDEFKVLLLKAIALGASGNCFKQVLDGEFSGNDFHNLMYAQQQIDEILQELFVTLGLEDRKVKVIKHKFY